MTPISGLELEGVLERRRGGLGPVRVVRRVEHDRRAAPDDLEAAGRGDLRERAVDDLRVERVGAEEGLDGGQRDGRVLRLVGAVQRQEDLVVPRPRRLDGDQLPAHRGRPVGHAEVDALAQELRADVDRSVAQHVGDVGLLLGDHGDRVGLDDPGLLPRDRDRVVAEQVGVVDGDRQHHGDGGVGHVGGVPGTAEPDLDDGDVDRGVGEGGVGHPHDGLEERQRVGLAGVDQVGVRRHVVERPHELLVGHRLAVEADPLGHPLDVRAGEAAGAQLERPEQRVDHPRRRRLAVRAGEVDHRVAVLRVAEQLGEGADPVERRLHPGLGPPREQGVLDLGEGLGKARLLIHSRHSRSR